jgi:hypothetical protein
MLQILVDTSYWIQFFQGHKETRILKDWIRENFVILYPYVYGELQLGGLSAQQLDLIRVLPQCKSIENEMIYSFIEKTTCIEPELDG